MEPKLQRSLKYIKYSLYFYAGLFLLLNTYNVISYQTIDYEIFRGLARGAFVGAFTYYMFKTRSKGIYWFMLVGASFYGLIGLVTWPFIIKYLPEIDATGEPLGFVLAVLLPIASISLLVAAYHLIKKDVRVYLTTGLAVESKDISRPQIN